MSTTLFVFCFILAGTIFSSHGAEVQGPPYNATAAFLSYGSYEMKYRNYLDDQIFGNYPCVSRWGGSDKRPDDPIKIKYMLRNYRGDPSTERKDIIVGFYNGEVNTFHYAASKSHNQKRKLIYLNETERCQVTKTYKKGKGSQAFSDCTLWMGYYKVDDNPPDECKKVYDNCGGSTKVQYHENCKYKPPEPKRH
uniref:Putative secreted protein n=1 Tax=Ixodes ricinus TaxID=34613 RepID=V5HAD8_IXORI